MMYASKDTIFKNGSLEGIDNVGPESTSQEKIPGEARKACRILGTAVGTCAEWLMGLGYAKELAATSL